MQNYNQLKKKKKTDNSRSCKLHLFIVNDKITGNKIIILSGVNLANGKKY